ncbi:MAG: trans-2-enoyl-CoA reductase family protein [Lachnospiraceae bacterium]|nr:trans-2-enoyl-CoA reductase family protein [Lachnospiraceae bacterium]
MIVEPKVRGFICTTAHPEGCRKSVENQIAYVKASKRMEHLVHAPKKVLVLGCSTGYGLASRITAAFGYGAATLGVMFEKLATQKRTATPGYYNTKAFEEDAKAEGLYAKTLNGDAFSNEMKQQVIEVIKEDLGQVDYVIYSLAAPRRTDKSGVTYSSVLKTTNEPYTNKTLDLRTNEIKEVTIEPATDEEVASTIKVMGGEDWEDWISALSHAGVLSPNATTVAYSYIGPEITYPIYFHGSIGMAKKDLYDTAKRMSEEYKESGLRSIVSVNKALVTQASAAIPIVPLYISILYKVMKEKNLHEGCIEQMVRLFARLGSEKLETDKEGRIRMDDYEMREDVQEQVKTAWKAITTETVPFYADMEGYYKEFYHMFGFCYSDIDYTKDVEI